VALCSSGRVGRCSHGAQRRLLHGCPSGPWKGLGTVSFRAKGV